MNELELYERLLDVINKDDINNILKIIYEYYQFPIMLIDGNYNLIAYYPDDKVEDVLWKSIIRDKYVSFDYVKFFNEKNMIQGQTFDREPKYYSMSPKAEHDRIIANLFIDDELLGYLAILTFQYDEKLCKTTKRVANFLTDYLVSHKLLSGNQNSAYRQFMTYLFEDRYETEKQFDEYCDFLQINRLGDYILLSCKVPASYSRKQLIRSLQREYGETKQIKSFYYKSNIYVLAERNSYDSYLKLFEEMTESRFGEVLYMGHSDRIYDLFELKRYKKQADMAAEYASQMKKSISFGTIVTKAMADCIKNNMAEVLYKHPLLLELKKYDNENGSEYYTTLKNYINSGCQLKKTSHNMNIHRNTLVYRLGVIEEKFQVDLTAIDLITQLYLNFKIEDL